MLKNKKASFAECPVCLEVFAPDVVQRTPKLLTCGHTFCGACLQKLLKKNSLKCPACRHTTKVYGGIESLNKNYALLDLVLMQQKGMDGSEDTKASCCENCDTGKSVQVYCPECDLELCELCSEKLHKMKAFRHHKPFKGRRKIAKLFLCDEHQEPLKVFCITCQAAICILCRWYGTHQEHETKLLTAVISEKQDDLKKTVKQMKERIERISNVSTKLFEGCESLDKYHKQVQHEIEAHFFDLAKVIRDRKKALLQQADNLVKERRTFLNAKLAEVALSKAKLEESCDELGTLISGNPVFLMGAVQKVTEQYSKIIAESLSHEEPAIDAIIHFSLSDSLRANLKEYGEVSIKKPEPPTIADHAASPTTLSVNWSSEDPTVECVLEISEEKDGEWTERSRCGNNHQTMVVKDLKPKTNYLYRLRCRYEYGWSEHTKPTQVITAAKWKFAGFATWIQNTAQQSDEQQDQLMNEACAQLHPQSRAASASMYSEGHILEIPPRNDTGLYLTFTSPGNFSDNRVEHKGHGLMAVSPGAALKGAFDFHNAHTGARACICVM